MKGLRLSGALGLAVVLILGACEGPIGETGAAGTAGTAGNDGSAGNAGAAGPAGAAGETGATGAAGAAGGAGTAGADGFACWDLNANDACDADTEDTNGDTECTVLDCRVDLQTAEYLGSPDNCAPCHLEIYESFIQTGHPYKLNAVVDGVIVSPVNPSDFLEGAEWEDWNPVADNLSDFFGDSPTEVLPHDLLWTDLSYVIGGRHWKARFVDTDGWIVISNILGGHGDEEENVQYNLPNADLALDDASWALYHDGDTEPKPYDCGPCHTTGYDLDATNELAGVVGTFASPGVQCEACHGPGSNHVVSQNARDIEIDRDGEACGRCHTRGGVNGVFPGEEFIETSGDFIKHHEQYDELWNTRHRSLNCVSCHDPHVSAWDDEDGNNGVIAGCDSCHWDRDIALRNARSTAQAAGTNHISFIPVDSGHGGMGDGDEHDAYPEEWVELECIDCHMSSVSKSARFVGTTGDVSTHIFAISTNDDYTFIPGNGDPVETPALSLERACAPCHETANGANDAPTTDMCRDCHSADWTGVDQSHPHNFPFLDDAVEALRDGDITIHEVD